MTADKNLNSIKEMLLQSGIRPSPARVRVYDYLQTVRNHPTVDTIYSALHPALLSLSRTTVYNTLNLFVKKGMVQPVFIDDEQVRYDANIQTHGHFKCLSCGALVDFPFEKQPPLFQHLEKGFEVRHTHLYAYGICSHCRNGK